jgi:hypothetical protein
MICGVTINVQVEEEGDGTMGVSREAVGESDLVCL